MSATDATCTSKRVIREGPRRDCNTKLVKDKKLPVEIPV